jgi:PAS domain S-box-containing protein
LIEIEFVSSVYQVGDSKVIQCNIRDITTRKHVEIALDKSEAFNRNLVEASPVGILFLDQDDRITYENPAMRRTMGVPEGIKSPVIGQKFYELASIKAALPAPIYQHMLSGATVTGEIIHYHSLLGPEVDLEVYSAPLNDVNGQREGTIILALDITERRLAAAALRESEERLHLTLEAVNDGVWDWDITTGNTIFSPRYYTLLGYELYEFPQNYAAWKSLVHPDDIDLAEREINKNIESGESYAIEIRMRTKSGGWRWTLGRGKVIERDAEGRVTRIVGTQSDISRRKQVENDLAAERSLLLALLDNIPDKIYFKDASSRFIRINRAQAINLGLSEPAQAIGKTDFDFYTEEHARPAFEDEQAILRSGQPLVGKEEKETYPDGRVKWASSTKMPLYDQAGQIIGTFGISRDITERRRVEETIQLSEARYRSLVETQSDAVARSDLDGRLTFVNDAYCRAFGRSREELIGQDFKIMVLPEDLPITIASEKIILSPPYRSRIETRHVTPQGIRWFSWESSAILNERGEMIELQGVGRDITQRKRVEQAVFLMSDAQRQIAHSDSLTDIFTLVGKTIQELLGDGYVVISVLDDQKQALRAAGVYGFGSLYNQIIRMFKVDPTKTLYYLKDMTPGELQLFRSGKLEKFQSGLFHLMTRKIPKSIGDAAEKVMKLTGIYTMGFVWQNLHFGGVTILAKYDITPYKDMIETIVNQATISIKRIQSEEKLKEYSESLEETVAQRTQELREAQEHLVRREKLAVIGQLAGSVAHELRNPLGVINNTAYYLNLILTDPDPTVKEYLKILSTEVEQAEHIISSLMNFARPQAARERVPVTVSELIDTAMLRHVPPDSVKFVQHVPSDLPRVVVDAFQIEQVLGNLIINAYQAMPEGGRLTLKARRTGAYIALAVTDTGSGISPENQAKLFEPLFTTKPKGIGLGLVTSKNLVEANDGKIAVKSTPGKGSTFTLILPI